MGVERRDPKFAEVPVVVDRGTIALSQDLVGSRANLGARSIEETDSRRSDMFAGARVSVAALTM